MNLQKWQLKLAAKMLRMASNEFDCHGCNDINLGELGVTEEQIQQLKNMREELDPTLPLVDWEVMDLLAELFEREGE